MSYTRDYETKGQPIIRLGGSIGAVNATTENFNMTAEQIMKDEDFIDRNNAESGVFCLVPDELTFLFKIPSLPYSAAFFSGVILFYSIFVFLLT
ncbi:hypothetical protein BJAS_P3372 [Bathymodiolus japonicus methanotrophic gill symbiont]|uniref:hypothetical protein n=1 Tax=Bathymodiolus japonicus methanotrophic gill symbiont TaxID=113269 RepID=UPI001B68CE0E|nr:hypothetical protein [Bathymodiolus japonicus methanotrophic gill symbiont]GFO72844.1 hypothetical protein BJAS_P3372 [Bathymodiolus japonicus methanotrophic gill symbiont]